MPWLAAALSTAGGYAAGAGGAALSGIEAALQGAMGGAPATGLEAATGLGGVSGAASTGFAGAPMAAGAGVSTAPAGVGGGFGALAPGAGVAAPSFQSGLMSTLGNLAPNLAGFMGGGGKTPLTGGLGGIQPHGPAGMLVRGAQGLGAPKFSSGSSFIDDLISQELSKSHQAPQNPYTASLPASQGAIGTILKGLNIQSI